MTTIYIALYLVIGRGISSRGAEMAKKIMLTIAMGFVFGTIISLVLAQAPIEQQKELDYRQAYIDSFGAANRGIVESKNKELQIQKKGNATNDTFSLAMAGAEKKYTLSIKEAKESYETRMEKAEKSRSRVEEIIKKNSREINELYDRLRNRVLKKAEGIKKDAIIKTKRAPDASKLLAARKISKEAYKKESQKVMSVYREKKNEILEAYSTVKEDYLKRLKAFRQDELKKITMAKEAKEATYRKSREVAQTDYDKMTEMALEEYKKAKEESEQSFTNMMDEAFDIGKITKEIALIHD